MSKLTVVLALGLAEAARALEAMGASLAPGTAVVNEIELDQGLGVMLAHASEQLCELDALGERHEPVVIDDALAAFYEAHPEARRPATGVEQIPPLLPFKTTFLNVFEMVISEWHDALRNPEGVNRRSLSKELDAAIDSALLILGFHNANKVWVDTARAYVRAAYPLIDQRLAPKTRKAGNAPA